MSGSGRATALTVSCAVVPGLCHNAACASTAQHDRRQLHAAAVFTAAQSAPVQRQYSASTAYIGLKRHQHQSRAAASSSL